MKRLLSIAFILCSFIASANVDFQFNLGNLQSDHLIGRAVLVTPLTLTNTPGSVPSKDPISYTTTNTGYFWISNVVSGTYQFEIQAPPRKTTYKFYIRGGTGVVIADSGLITETNSTDAQTFAYTIAGANAAFVQNLGLASEVTTTNSPTAAYALGTPDGTNLAWIQATGGGGTGQTNWSISVNITNANWLTNWALIPPNGKWDTNGNDAGAGGFLGTTNATNLRFKSNGTNWLTIRTDGSLIAGPGNDSFLTPSVILSPFGGNTNSGSINSSILGGSGNIISNGLTATIVGGVANSILGGGLFDANGSVIVGGINNVIQTNSGRAIIVGGSGNVIQDNSPIAIIVGGNGNTVLRGAGGEQFIGNGVGNTASGDGATIVNGELNTASADDTFVGAGLNNTASGLASVIVGGQYNIASGGSSGMASVGGGLSNSASGSFSSVAGGSNNIASGIASAVAGGASNTASGTYSFAAGRNAQATNTGSFVWADSQSSGFVSTNNDSFNIRAQGGVKIKGDLETGWGFSHFGNGWGESNHFVLQMTNANHLTNWALIATNLMASKQDATNAATAVTNNLVATNDTRPLNLNNSANQFVGNFVGTGSGLTNLNAWGTNYIIASTLPGIRLDSSLTLGGGHNDWAPLQAALDRYTNGKPLVLALDGVAQINRTLVIHSNTTLLSLNKAGGLWLTNNSNCTMLQNDLNTNMASPNISIIGVVFSGNRANQACFTNGAVNYNAGEYTESQGQKILGMWFAGVTNLLIRDVTMFDAGVYFILCNDSRFIREENVSLISIAAPVCGGDGFHFYGGCSDIFMKNCSSLNGSDDQLALNASEKIQAWRAPFWNTNANTISNIVIDGYTCINAHSPFRIMDNDQAGNGHVYNLTLKNIKLDDCDELANEWPQQSPGSSITLDGLSGTLVGGGDLGNTIVSAWGCSNFVAKNIFLTQIGAGVPLFDTRGCSNVVLSSMVINVTGGAAGDTLIDADGTFQTANKPSQNVLLSDIIFNGGGNVIGGNANKTLASNVRAIGGATFNSGNKANVWGGDGTNGFVANPFIGNASGLTNFPALATAYPNALTNNDKRSLTLTNSTSVIGGGLIGFWDPSNNNWMFATPGTTQITFSNSITLNNGGIYSGSGAGLTSIPAAQLTGSIADARLSANVSLLGQTISEGELALTDVTTANASTSAHGFVKKLPNDATQYYDGTGAYSVPAGSGIPQNAGFGTNATIYGDSNKTNALVVNTAGVTISNANGYVNDANGNILASGNITSTNGVISGNGSGVTNLLMRGSASGGTLAVASFAGVGASVKYSGPITNDSHMQVTLTVGSSGNSGGTAFTNTFSTPYKTVPFVAYVPRDSNTANRLYFASYCFITNVTVNSFEFAFGATAPAANTVMVMDFLILQ